MLLAGFAGGAVFVTNPGDAAGPESESTADGAPPTLTVPGTLVPKPDHAAPAEPSLRALGTWRPAPSDALPADLVVLSSQVDALLATLAPTLQGATVSVAVRDQDGRVVVDHDANTPLLPASTMKSVTAALVLATFPPDHRFETRVVAPGEVTDGVVDGDLVLVGGGDPVLSTDEYRTWVYPARPSTSLEDLADAVVAAGVERVEGGLRVDSTALGGSSLAPGWRPDYLMDQNARHITALTVDAGLDVAITEREGDSPQVELHINATPDLDAGAELAALLAERGVAFTDGVRRVDAPTPEADTVAAVSSPTVAELLTWTIRRSDNPLADTLVRVAALGATGDGSWAAADRGAAEALRAVGVDPTGLHVADGSGLSRLDRVTAGLLADLDTAMAHTTVADVWQESLAIAGEEGTLRGRLVGTAGQGRFLGKTGTLDDVKAVVGRVLPTDPAVDARRLHVSVVANGMPTGGSWAVTVLMDQLALLLVDHLDGCTSVTDDAGTVTRTCA